MHRKLSSHQEFSQELVTKFVLAPFTAFKTERIIDDELLEELTDSLIFFIVKYNEYLKEQDIEEESRYSFILNKLSLLKIDLDV